MGSQKGGRVNCVPKKGDELNGLDAKSKKQTNKGERERIEWVFKKGDDLNGFSKKGMS